MLIQFYLNFELFQIHGSFGLFFSYYIEGTLSLGKTYYSKFLLYITIIASVLLVTKLFITDQAGDMYSAGLILLLSSVKSSSFFSLDSNGLLKSEQSGLFKKIRVKIFTC